MRKTMGKSECISKLAPEMSIFLDIILIFLF